MFKQASQSTINFEVHCATHIFEIFASVLLFFFLLDLGCKYTSIPKENQNACRPVSLFLFPKVAVNLHGIEKVNLT